MSQSTVNPAAALAPLSMRKDPALKTGLPHFLRTNNWTNFLFIARAYIVAGLAFAAAITFFEWQQSSGNSFWWNLPVYFLALLAIGASQHQLAGAGHEAVHHTLFRNRRLNELASDWLCMFPVFTSTYQFRLYHLAHHQFVNDPEHDPDFSMLEKSGHWMGFPVSKAKFLWTVFRQVFLVELFRYILVRIRLNSVGTDENSPYRREGRALSPVPGRILVVHFLGLVGILIFLQLFGKPWHFLVAIPVWWGLIAIIFARLPAHHFEGARLKPVIPPRATFIGQAGFFTLLLGTLGFVQASSGVMVLRWFSLLWVVSLITTFPFFMILRQLVQHGNGGRGWLTNTRVFKVNPLLRYAVFPFGMDYHLPHHMYATVPHYRLKALHEFLLGFPEYREEGIVVENYLVPRGSPPRNPTVVEVLGPEYACESGGDVFIDESVLDNEVMEK